MPVAGEHSSEGTLSFAGEVWSATPFMERIWQMCEWKPGLFFSPGEICLIEIKCHYIRVNVYKCCGRIVVENGTPRESPLLKND